MTYFSAILAGHTQIWIHLLNIIGTGHAQEHKIETEKAPNFKREENTPATNVEDFEQPYRYHNVGGDSKSYLPTTDTQVN